MASSAPGDLRDQPDCPLFTKLSPELRNKIYDLVLISDKPIDITDESQPSFTRSCKMIRNECLPMYLGSNKFEYNTTSGGHDGFDGFKAWLRRIGTENHTALKSLRIVIRHGCMITSLEDSEDAWTAMIPQIYGRERPSELRVELVLSQNVGPCLERGLWMRLKHGSKAPSKLDVAREMCASYYRCYANMLALLSANNAGPGLQSFHDVQLPPKHCANVLRKKVYLLDLEWARKSKLRIETKVRSDVKEAVTKDLEAIKPALMQIDYAAIAFLEEGLFY